MTIYYSHGKNCIHSTVRQLAYCQTYKPLGLEVDVLSSQRRRRMSRDELTILNPNLQDPKKRGLVCTLILRKNYPGNVSIATISYVLTNAMPAARGAEHIRAEIKETHLSLTLPYNHRQPLDLKRLLAIDMTETYTKEMDQLLEWFTKSRNQIRKDYLPPDPTTRQEFQKCFPKPEYRFQKPTARQKWSPVGELTTSLTKNRDRAQSDLSRKPES